MQPPTSNMWPVQPVTVASHVPGDPSEAGPVKASKSRALRRPRRQDSSYLAIMFLIGAGFFLLGVVIIVILALSL